MRESPYGCALSVQLQGFRQVRGACRLWSGWGKWREPQVGGVDVLVVRLSLRPQEALATLLQLGAPSLQLPPSARLVLLTAFAPTTLHWVLALVGVRQRVSIVSDALPVAAVMQAVFLPPKAAHGDVDVAWGAVPVPPPFQRLSERERVVLWQSLQDIPISHQARGRVLSIKTLYTQRSSAFRKLGVAHRHGLLLLLTAGPGRYAPEDA
ncbi:hypothetical protein [Serratia bockelmannii]|uniref:hypothetical protein n=1 Tax=Serratia bockelmannii TaxID=2703793 RepID=UPI00235EF3A3|nr:hypothetical protein [Serratia bockelmannii]